MAKIIDVIQPPGGMTLLVLDEMPKLQYSINDDRTLITGEADGFFTFYNYGKGSGIFKAFAGAKIVFGLVTGEKIESEGDWWWCDAAGVNRGLMQYGVGSLDSLGNCYVFQSAYYDPKIVLEWLKHNTPKNDFWAYDKRKKPNGAQRY